MFVYYLNSVSVFYLFRKVHKIIYFLYQPKIEA